MKVDVPSLIIGICALATFAVPIAWYQISEKIKAQKLHNEITRFARQENLTLTNEEVWGDHYALGIDNNSRKIVYLKQSEDGDQKEIIDLSNVQKCKVTNRTKNVHDTNGKKNVLTGIDLLFHFRNSGRRTLALEVYKDSNGRSLTHELSIANKLARKIRALIDTNTNSYKLTNH